MAHIRLIDNDTILIDGSRFDNIQKCELLGYYTYALQKRRPEERAPLRFGRAIHLAMKIRYEMCGTGSVSDLCQAHQMRLLEKFWENHPTPMGDHRTLGFAQDVIWKYNEFYGDEPFSLLEEGNGGRVIVEEPFAMPLGTFIDKWGTKIHVVWTGRLDLPIRDPSGYWILDHKTTSVGSEYAMADHLNSSSMKGYTWVLAKRFKIPVRGAIINHIVCRKPAKTGRGKGIEFARGYVPFEEERLVEWAEDALQQVQHFYECDLMGHFPMRTSQCTHKFGRCEFLDVCTLPPCVRQQALQSESFVDDDWSPLQQDDLFDLNKLLAEPIDVNKYNRRPKVLATPIDGPSINDVLSDLAE